MATSSPTLGRYLDDWLRTVVEPDLRPKTAETYAMHVRLYIAPGLGSKRLDKLTVRDLRSWVNELLEQCQCCAQGKDSKRPKEHKDPARRQRCCAVGRCCRQVPSRRTVQDARAVLRSALTNAMTEEVITKNVAGLVKVRSARKTKRHPWSVWVVGVLQTPDYARAVLTRSAELHRSPRDIEEAVRARMKRQELLYSGGRRYHVILWEPVLRSLVCPPSVLIAQLDRLTGVIGMDTVELGIVPLTASLKVPPGLGFWIYDDRQVATEAWHAELWLDDDDSVALYLRTWKTLRESAVYGADAHNVINAARRALNPR